MFGRNKDKTANYIRMAYKLGQETGKLSNEEYILTRKASTNLHTIEMWMDEVKHGYHFTCSGIGCAPDCPARTGGR